MSFTDHKITAFAHRVADLPDEPQIPAADLKSRFDACPEELRQSLNAVCDDAARLEARVEGIVVDTFGDTIDKEMLSDELAAELDGKATQSALDSTANALDERLDAVETALPLKCECYFGTYTGNGDASRFIDLGFTPKAIISTSESGLMAEENGCNWHYGGICLPDRPIRNHNYQDTIYMQIETNGFRVYYSGGSNDNGAKTNAENREYYFIAIR